jgi:hypothetical protein
LIKPGIWGSGLDVLLTALRAVIREASGKFPDQSLEREMRVRGKSLTFSLEEVEELADMKYGSRDLFGLLTLLFPFVDTRNQFHIDHVFPSAVFHARKLKQRGLSEDEIARLQDSKDRLSNLQLLEGPDNQSKSDKMPAEWIAETYPEDDDRKDYISRYMLDGVMTDLSGFEVFFKGRRQRLLERIVVVLNGPMSASKESTAGREMVLEVGSEGGSLTLLRERNAGGDWKFLMKTNESALYDLLSEEDRNKIGEYFAQTGYVHSFHEALGLLDRYPWSTLYPLEVHPEFLERVLLEVGKRGGGQPKSRVGGKG